MSARYFIEPFRDAPFTPIISLRAMNAEDLAPFLYARFTDSIGGKAPDGSNLPMWAEFAADERNAKWVRAWIATAQEAITQLADEYA